MTGAFGQELHRLRTDRGLSLRQLAKLIPASRGYVHQLEHGLRRPTPGFAARLDDALGAGGLLVELAAREAAERVPIEPADVGGLVVINGTAVEPGRPLDADDVARMHATIGHLVALDNAHGADDIASLAVRTYRQADRALAAGRYEPAVERDLQATAGELAELAGWLLYDADRQDDARRLSTEALLTTRLAGDRDTELLTLANLAMQSIHLGRGREALRIAEMVLDSGRLPNRVAALFHARRGRALAMLGDRPRALAALALARSLLADGIGADDPPWAWWVDDPELTAYEGMSAHVLDRPGPAADLLRGAVEAVAPGKRRGRYSYLAFLLNALVDAQAWAAAEQVVGELWPYVEEVASARVATLLRDIAGRVERASGVPGSLRDALRALVARLPAVCG